MNYTQYKRNTIQNRLKIDTESVIHVFPDYDMNILDIIDKINLLRANLQGVTIKNIRLANKRINSTDYIQEIKKSEETKNFRMFLSVPEITTNRYIIIDHTLAVERLRDLSERMSANQLTHYLFDYLAAEFENMKTLNAKITQIPLFIFKNESGLFNVIDQGSKYKLGEIKLFDKFAFGCDLNSSMFTPIIAYGDDKQPEFLKQNISKIKSFVTKTNDDIIQKPEETKDYEFKVDQDKEPASNNIEKLSISEYDNIALSNILRKYNVRDPQVAEIVKSTVDDYKKKYKDYSKDDIEQVIFKAIHHSLYGKVEITKEVKDDPKILFARLSEKVNFSTPIYYPKIKQETLVRPKEVVKLESVAGPARLENEFKENIHKNVDRLFKGLETRQHPIKIKKLTHEIKDNNLDRFIEYTITVQNVTGGIREPYDVKVRIPTLVNGRYFKFSGKEYILSSQQFLMPITKNKPTQARLRNLD